MPEINDRQFLAQSGTIESLIYGCGTIIKVSNILN